MAPIIVRVHAVKQISNYWHRTCRLILLPCVLALGATSPVQADGSEQHFSLDKDQFLKNYVRENSRVRDFYSNVKLQATIKTETEELDGGAQRLLNSWTVELTCYTKGSVYCVIWGQPAQDWARMWLVQPSNPVEFKAAWRPAAKRWLQSEYLARQTYEDALFSIRQLARVPFDIFCVNYEPLEDYFKNDPHIRLSSVEVDEIRGRKAIRATFIKTNAQTKGKVLGSRAIWFDTEGGWVILRSQSRFPDTLSGISAPGYLIDLYYDYPPGGIPQLRRLAESHIYSSSSRREASGTLTRLRTDIHVTLLEPLSSSAALTPESLGVPRWHAMWAWLRYHYWYQYAIPEAIFFIQLSLIVLLVLWIACRRWRRRRLARTNPAPG